MFKLNKLLFFLVISLLSCSSYASQDESERNWRSSLNVKIKGYEDDSASTINEWINSTKEYVSEEYKNDVIQTLMSENIRSCNMATAQFKLLYEVEGSDTLQIVTFTPSTGRISLSGQRQFKDDIALVDRNKIISGRSFELTEGFISSSRSENGKRCDDIKQRINSLIRSNIVTEGGHAEAYLLLELYKSLPDMLSYCSSRHSSQNITILGTILTISSLKDPCQQNCFPMLRKFNQELPIIMRSLPSLTQISFTSNFERVLLIGARDPHNAYQARGGASTRDDFNALHPNFNQQIELNFATPQARIFSARFEEL
jgi:hypothetical protein